MKLSLKSLNLFFFFLLKAINADSSVTKSFLETTVNGIRLENERNHSVEITIKAADSMQKNSKDINSENVTCAKQVVFQGPYEIMENEFAYIPTYNKTFSPAFYENNGSKLILCIEGNDGEVIRNNSQGDEKKTGGLHCQMWEFEPHEFEILENGSVVIMNEIFGPDKYMKDGDKILMCAPDDVEDENSTETKNVEYTLEDRVLIYIGNILTGISIIALSLHMIAFGLLLDNRNLPGYNLTSLSLSLFLAYSFFLIGQIPEVLGTSCIVSGVLQQYFFLASFFWMNIMSFDVWRALQLATTKLHASSRKIKGRKFLLYSVCAWVLPLSFVISAVIADNVDTVPDEYKPFFGRSDYCWFTNSKALFVFFAGPIFSLIIINSIFFAMTAYIIVNNSIKEHRDQQVTAARRNFMLYVRLGLIMGVTWLIGIIGNATGKKEVWYIFTILNTAQGVFIFIFFTCTRKIWKIFKKKVGYEVSTTSSKQSTSTLTPIHVSTTH